MTLHKKMGGVGGQQSGEHSRERANEQREKLRGEVKEPGDFYHQECQSLLQYKSPPVPQTFRKVLHNVPKRVFVFAGNHGKGCI